MKILFQGDSITDAGRGRENPHELGAGYPKYAAELIREDFPDTEFEFINLGISGNQTKDLVERLESDFIDIDPDIVSIMIGINDVWHHAADRSWIPSEIFEQNYRTVLSAVREKTSAKIIILEPYLLPVPDKENMREDLDRKIHIVRKLAREFADVYIPTDGLFASGMVDAELDTFSADGVHPNETGARYIADYYADAVYSIIENM